MERNRLRTQPKIYISQLLHYFIMPANTVFDLSFIPSRSVQHRTPALPSARITAREKNIDISSVAHDTYINKQDVCNAVDMNTYPTRNIKCEFITQSLDCAAGAFGHIGCLDEKFHERCDSKQRLLNILKERELKRTTP